VTAADVRRVARAYLQPWQRTIGWYLAGDPPTTQRASPVASRPNPEPAPAASPGPDLEPIDLEPIAPPSVRRLESGLPVLFQDRPLSSSAYLRVLVPAADLRLAPSEAGPPVGVDRPVWRHTSLDVRFRPHQLPAALAAAAHALRGATATDPEDPAEVEDPALRLALELDQALGAGEPGAAGVGVPGVTAVALVGDLREAEALPLVAAAFGAWEPRGVEPKRFEAAASERRVTLDVAGSQAQLGYVVAAPAAGSPEACAWRSLLYVLSHGYEGRLGREAISRRGLLYYVDAGYSSDGVAGRVSLQMGVDPAKLEALRELLLRSLRELQERPPTAAELAEARSHFLGRRASAAQSPEEVSRRWLADWVTHGRLLDAEEHAAVEAACDLQDVLRVVPAFVRGTVVSVEVDG
jgi:hypothetical protein